MVRAARALFWESFAAELLALARRSDFSALLFTFLLPWRGSPEEGRRSGFDSHEFNGRRSLHRVRLPDGI